MGLADLGWWGTGRCTYMDGQEAGAGASMLGKRMESGVGVAGEKKGERRRYMGHFEFGQLLFEPETTRSRLRIKMSPPQEMSEKEN